MSVSVCPLVVKTILGEEELSIIREDEMDWVPLKPLCEGLGLNWAGERSRLKNDAKFTGRFWRMKGTDGKGRDFLCLPLYQLSGWLFSLNTGRVRKEMKGPLEAFQRESMEALFSHWLPAAKDEIQDEQPDTNGASADFAELLRLGKEAAQSDPGGPLEEMLKLMSEPDSKEAEDEVGNPVALFESVAVDEAETAQPKAQGPDEEALVSVSRETVEEMVRASGLLGEGGAKPLMTDPGELESRVKSVIENVLGELAQKP